MKKFIALFLLVFPALAVAPTPATLTLVQGNVKVDGRVAAKGSQLATGSMIATEAASFCDVALDPMNSFRVRELSSVRVNALWEESRKPDGSVVKKVQLDLTRGGLASKLDKLPSGTEYEVRTPIAVAAARGTFFGVDIGIAKLGVNADERGVGLEAGAGVPGVAGASANLGVGANGLQAGAGANVGDIRAGGNAGIGPNGVQAGANANVPGLVGANVGAGVGPNGVNAGGNANVAGVVGAGANAGLGPNGVQAGAGANVGDLRAGGSAGVGPNGVAAGAGVGVGQVGLGANAGVGPGGVGVGVGMPGGPGVGLGVGLPPAPPGVAVRSFAVGVVHGNVQVVSSDSPNKTVSVKPYQQISVSPWELAQLRARGTGLLSERILGKQFIKERQEVAAAKLRGVGVGPDEASAKQKAYSQLTHIIYDLKVEDEKPIEAFIMQDEKLANKLFDFVATAKAAPPEQLPDGKVRVMVELDGVGLQDALGGRIAFKRTVVPVSLGEYGKIYGPVARVTTERAAEIDAFRRLAEKIYGVVIDSQTTVENFAVKNDTIRQTVKGVVQGAETVETIYYSDGSVKVVKVMNGALIPKQLSPTMGNVFGQNYMGSPEVIEFASFEQMLPMMR